MTPDGKRELQTGTYTWTGRARASLRRRVVWPLGGRLVRTPAWNAALAGYAAVASRGVLPGRRTDAAPLSLRWIDPNRTVYDALAPTPEPPPIGRVVGGGWDQLDDRFAERAVPRAIERRFRDGSPWDETPLPAHVRDQVARFGDAWGYVEDAVERRCRAIDALYEAMRVDGYRTQAELAARVQDSTGAPPVPVLGEITVDIGRDGHLCWRGTGQHRLAIARVLGIDRVPVLVARRHARWQGVRDRVRAEGFGAVRPSVVDHPDLADLREAAGPDGP